MEGLMLNSFMQMADSLKQCVVDLSSISWFLQSACLIYSATVEITRRTKRPVITIWLASREACTPNLIGGHRTQVTTICYVLPKVRNSPLYSLYLFKY